MLAEKSPAISEAAKTIYRVSEDERLRLMCEAREEGEKTQRTIELIHQMELQQVQDELQQKDNELRQKDDEIAKLRAQLAEYIKQ